MELKMNDDRFKKLEDSIERIEVALLGDKEMGNTGIAQRLRDVEKKCHYHGRIITYVTMAWTVIVGALIYFKSHVAESIINKIN
jgi:hypothetical protein